MIFDQCEIIALVIEESINCFFNIHGILLENLLDSFFTRPRLLSCSMLTRTLNTLGATMSNLLLQVSLSFLLLTVSKPVLGFEKNHTGLSNKVVMTADIQKDLDETCLDEYALRNSYLRKFIIWVPPTMILSLPLISQAYLIAILGWTVLPFKYLDIAIITAALTGPAIIGTAIYFEARHTIEYFGNRRIVKVLDALRLEDYSNSAVFNFINKFREKYPESNLTDEQLFSEVLNLDIAGSLCNGDLTETNSNKLKKLLAKSRHLFRYLSKL